MFGDIFIDYTIDPARTDHTYNLAFEEGGVFAEWYKEIRSIEEFNGLILKRDYRLGCHIQVPNDYKKSDIKKVVKRELQYIGEDDKAIKKFFREHKIVEEKNKAWRNENTVIYKFIKKEKTKLHNSTCKKCKKCQND